MGLKEKLLVYENLILKGSMKTIDVHNNIVSKLL
jgi:hypothetical protein